MERRRWAQEQAETKLASLGDRWAHVQAVAHAADQVSAILPMDERDLLIAAAYLHDIGYAPGLTETGFHPLDGARHLERLGVERRLCCLVAHHSAARFEAQERGLAEELAAFDLEDSPVADALVYADMTTGPAGQPVAVTGRIDEILRRYPENHPVHRAISCAHPVLLAAVERTRRRLAAWAHRGDQPMYGAGRCSR